MATDAPPPGDDAAARTTRPDAGAVPPAPGRDIARLFAGRGFELLVGAGVLLISLVSLFVAVSANRTQERLLAASVWPHLMFGTGNVDAAGAEAITLDLINRGVGPARVRWVELTHDGVPIADAAGLLRQCCGVPSSAVADIAFTTSRLNRRTIGADEWVVFFRMPRVGNPQPMWETLDRELAGVRLRACYCSVLDDCWMLDSRRDEPAPMAQCPTLDTAIWSR